MRVDVRDALDTLRAALLAGLAAALLVSVVVGALVFYTEARTVGERSWAHIFPTPRAIYASWQQHRVRLLQEHIPETLWETTSGLAMAVLLGVGIAALMDFVPLLRWLLYPVLLVSQTVPVFAVAILLILIFGFGSSPKIAVVVLFCFFPVALSTFAGLQAADPELLALLRAMGANARQVWLKARLPAAMPSFFSGLRIAATYSVVGAIFGEYITAQRGLGVFLKRSYSSYRLDQAYLAILLSAALSVLLVVLVNLVERLVLRWYYTAKRASWRGTGIY